MTSFHKPIFPPEISTSFLEHLDWTEAWQNRAVCHAWRRHIEHNLVPRIWLPDVKIIFDPHDGDVLGFTFHFQHRDKDDGDCAVFGKLRCPDSKILQRLGVELCHNIQYPIIVMSTFAHDIVLPSLTVDWEAMELRLNWRELFVHFLREESKSDEHYCKKVAKQYATVQQIYAEVEAGLLDRTDGFLRALKITESARISAYRETRVARLGFSDPLGDVKLQHIRLYFRLGLQHMDFDSSSDEYDESEDEWDTEDGSGEGSDGNLTNGSDEPDSESSHE